MPQRYRIAIALTLAVVAYFVSINYVPLFPWNDLSQQGSQIASTLTGVIPLLIGALALGRRWMLLMFAAAVFVWVWWFAQLSTWWPSYLVGPVSDFHAEYSSMVHLLPAIDGRPGPDAQHLLLQALTLVAAVATSVALVAEFRYRRASRSNGANERVFTDSSLETEAP